MDTMARAYTAVGRTEDAVAILAPICDSEPNGEDCDGLVMALTTLSEVHRVAGNIDAAQATLDRSRRLIERYGLTGRDTDAQREQAELYAARGEYREAFETFRAFPHRREQAAGAGTRPAGPVPSMPSSGPPRPGEAATTSASCPSATR